MPEEQKETAGKGAEAESSAKQQTGPSAKDTQKSGVLRRAYRAAKKVAKYTFITTVVTSPIRGTPGNMAVRFAQSTGVLPTIGSLENQEFPYHGTADKEFTDGIEVAPLPAIPLRSSRVGNYVVEPNGRDLPAYFMHGESVLTALSTKRMNTTILHAQAIASTYDHTLEKILGRKSNVKLIDGFASEGLIFNGPQVELFKHNKTIINKSVGAGAFEPDCDVSNYKAWIFFAAGNLGRSSDSKDVQPQLGGIANHGPRSVMVGAAFGATHCGPVFYATPSTKGTVKAFESRWDFLPSAIPKGSDGSERVFKGWGATSNSSPAAAARFSALMERYGNYLSEEQIFTALCYATSRETEARLSAELEKATRERPWDVKRISDAIVAYQSTNMPIRPAGQKHCYDPSMYGFGEITQAALAQADQICQDLVLYTNYHPESVSQPTTIKANIRLSERASRNPEGFYVYKLKLPAEVNLNNVVLQGSVATPSLKDEKVFLVANGIKIRVPVGHTNPLKQQEWVGDGVESGLIGSTRGFTGAGPVRELELMSDVPLKDDFCLTCYNTLSHTDAVSHLGSLHADVDNLQLHSKQLISLRTARTVDPKKIDPNGRPMLIRLYPANVSQDEILQDQQRELDENRPPPVKKDQQPPMEKDIYWRRLEVDPPPSEPYIGRT